MSAADIVLVATAGLLCGVVNTVAGGGSLILFPALLATGMPTLAANVTNSLGTWPGYVGGVVGFRREIDELRHHLRPFLVANVLGSTTGCVLLLLTPGDAFDVIVPWLVLFAAVLTAVQPSVKRRALAAGRGGTAPGGLSIAAVFVATIYGGYFGAALGVILVGVLGLAIHDTMHRITALKSALSLLDATVSVIIFGIFGPVRWVAVAVAAPTTLLGGYLGAAVARRLDEAVLRVAIVVFGVGVAIYLFLR